MDCSLPGYSGHGILQARPLEWVTISFSRQDHWNGLPFPSPGDLPNSEAEPTSPAFVCCSVNELCQTLCDPMDCCMLGSHVLHYLLEFTQIHVHWVSDAIQSSHPLLLPSPIVNLSQHQGLFQWVGFSNQVAKNIGASALAAVLPMSVKCLLPLGMTGLISLLSKGLSVVFSGTILHWQTDYLLSHQGSTMLFNTLSLKYRRIVFKNVCQVLNY